MGECGLQSFFLHEDGPYLAFAVSNSGSFLACLSDRGTLKILAVEHGLREQATATVGDSKTLDDQKTIALASHKTQNGPNVTSGLESSVFNHTDLRFRPEWAY